MSEKVIELKRRAQHNLNTNWGLQRVLKKRKALLRASPMSDEVTKLDRWLVDQPLPANILIDIWKRTIHAEWVMFGDLTRAQRHAFLIRLREHYHLEFCRLPVRVQKKMWPAWQTWLDEFREEEAEAANGAA